MRGFVFLSVMLGLLLAGCGDSGNAQQLAPFSTIQKGEVSPHDDKPAQLSVIRNNTDWVNFWNLLYTNYSPKPVLPPVNFTENYIIAVVDAPRSSGGYSITITSIQPTSAGITVSANQVSPGRGCIVTLALTQPFHFVAVPIFQGEATLALSQSVYNCDQ